ncbi:MAG: ABC transporter permease [Anaerolineae bacterium]|nr:ABC transporter permease [Anaerolineae bacterium]NUQ07134.1 ABC transporter permease [Anaerolineae bacterium]
MTTDPQSRPMNISRRSTLWGSAFRRLLQDRLTLLAASVLFFLTFVCVLGPPVVENVLKVDVESTSVRDRYKPPSAEHPIGTDHLGRDLLIRLLFGGRISLAVAYVASTVSMSIGVMVGILAGFVGGVVDDLILWLITTLSSIPALFLLIIATVIWSPSAETLILFLAGLGWIETARLIRGQTITLKHQEYVLAARALGSTRLRLMVRHILPNVLSIAIISMTINAGALILLESGLSFLGLGVQPPTPTWGNMLTEARSYFDRGIHLVFFPGIAITVTVLCFFLFGDGLRDALDPRQARR